jgi:formate/nitrite transporter FocA (FNT family)
MKKLFSNYIYHTIRESILAGIFIALGGTIFLSVGGTTGAIMFSVGLISVVLYNAQLFTGKAGFLPYKDLPILFGLILVGNMIGTSLVAFMLSFANYDLLISSSKSLIETRIANDLLPSFIRSIFCGMLMTIAIYGTKKEKYLPLLFCVPVFILSGFYHSIADWFYFSLSGFDNFLQYFPIWCVIVIGNYIGCNIPRKILLTIV